MYFSKILLIKQRREIGLYFVGEKDAGEDLGIGTTKEDFQSRGTRRDGKIQNMLERIGNGNCIRFQHPR